ncbi:peptidase propeptide and ypeb domain protein [Achromobacter xylosoxidans A8]|uniref:Peptidase propeptide and ypeb domain protein n=2 Tax=Alcaligenes xylosoxydans xylosoxydans TaxID=85698 RepID=E3HSQ4_ACHXA|nr:peptidase propeptide and ypeb domain protein [Achromobacter xylosoxidans A8]
MTRGMRTRIWLSCGALMLALAVGPGTGVADESDHEQARQALQAGKVLPLRSVLDIVERDYPGQVVKVEFEEDDGEFIYEIRLLQSGGRLVKLKIDARDGKVLGVKGRDIQFRDKH